MVEEMIRYVVMFDLLISFVWVIYPKEITEQQCNRF